MKKCKAKFVFNTMVANESHCILRMLESVYKYVDYWVIQDNGSTDGTQDLIKNFFAEKEIPGFLYEIPWSGCMGQNRDHTVQTCLKADHGCDWILRVDADEVLEVDDDFVGSLEYERWVKCKPCDGTGKDFSSKIVIRDLEGNIVKTFDSDGGCDYCEGTGKDYNGSSCYFCLGKGKIGLNGCNSCSGDGRIMGKQKLKGIKLTGNDTRIESMGHWSKNGIGYLLLSKK